MIKFHSEEQAGGYINFGLKMTPERTKELAESILRSEMLKNEDTARSARKTAYVLLLHFRFDDNWLRDEFLPELEKQLYGKI